MSKCLCCRNDGELDNDGICVTCNLEDYCSGCNQHELDCTCLTTNEGGEIIYGFNDNDFGDEDDPHDDLDDWEGDDWDDDD